MHQHDEKDGEGMSDLKSLTAAQVKKLPCGAKVVIKGKRKDKVCTVTQEGYVKNGH